MNKKQESQLKKLNLIEEKLNKFCEQFELNLNLSEKNKQGLEVPSIKDVNRDKMSIEKPSIKWDEKVFENLKRPAAKQDVTVKVKIFFRNLFFKLDFRLHYFRVKTLFQKTWPYTSIQIMCLFYF